jgi:Xaa-Pro aminopeptidase
MKKDLDALMEKNDIDAFFVMGAPAKSKNMYYLTGPSKITGGYILKKRGKEPLLIHGSMERGEAGKTGLECVSMGELDSVKIFKEAKTAFHGNLGFIAKIFEHFGVTGRVAFYGDGPVSYYYPLIKHVDADIEGVSVAEEIENNMLAQARITKDDAEIRRIKAIGQKAQRIMTEVRDYISTHGESDGLVVKPDKSPLTIGDVKEHLETLVAREKIVVEVDTIFAQGRDAGIPHAHGTDADPIRTGKTIVFDFFPKEKGGGYFFDMTRTLCPGRVPPEVQKVYDLVREVHDKVIESLEPGISMKLLDEMVCGVFEKAGHPTLRTDSKTEKGYVHSLGHGLGLDLHERPRVSQMAKDDDVLAPGFVFTVEPGLYFPDDEIGVRLEDVVAVWEDGKIENLTIITKDPLVPLKG